MILHVSFIYFLTFFIILGLSFAFIRLEVYCTDRGKNKTKKPQKQQQQQKHEKTITKKLKQTIFTFSYEK
jgi:hypothetical protein